MVEVFQENRWAYLIPSSAEEREFLFDYYSFFAPSARYDRRYKLFLWAKQKAEAQGDTEIPKVGWDGKIRMYKDGRVPAGLFRATKAELKTKLRLKVHCKFPHVKLRKAELPTDKYRFQGLCARAMCRATHRGGGIVLAATGSGKTKTASDYFRCVPEYECLFVVDTLDLLHQSAKELEQWLREPVGIVGEGTCVLERVTVATSQTLSLHKKDRKFSQWFKRIQIVLVDELHEQMGRRNFKVLEEIEPIACFGLTATLELGRKPVRMKAWSFCGPVVFSFPIMEATERHIVTEGKVLQLLFPRVDSEATYKGMQGYLDEQSLEVLKNQKKLLALRKICGVMLKEDKYVLVLAQRIKHVDRLSRKLQKPNYAIQGNVKRGVRDESKAGFEQGDCKLMIASTVFKKGVSIRRVDGMIDVAEGGSKNDALQKYGRGVRLHEDKDCLYYIDIGTDGGRFGTRAKRRRRAFIAAKIPILTVKLGEDTPIANAVRAVKKFLRS